MAIPVPRDRLDRPGCCCTCCCCCCWAWRTRPGAMLTPALASTTSPPSSLSSLSCGAAPALPTGALPSPSIAPASLSGEPERPTLGRRPTPPAEARMPVAAPPEAEPRARDPENPWRVPVCERLARDGTGGAIASASAAATRALPEREARTPPGRLTLLRPERAPGSVAAVAPAAVACRVEGGKLAAALSERSISVPEEREGTNEPRPDPRGLSTSRRPAAPASAPLVVPVAEAEVATSSTKDERSVMAVPSD